MVSISHKIKESFKFFSIYIYFGFLIHHQEVQKLTSSTFRMQLYILYRCWRRLISYNRERILFNKIIYLGEFLVILYTQVKVFLEREDCIQLWEVTDILWIGRVGTWFIVKMRSIIVFFFMSSWLLRIFSSFSRACFISVDSSKSNLNPFVSKWIGVGFSLV